MFLNYENKKSETEILKREENQNYPFFSLNNNLLFKGENLKVLKTLLYQKNMKGKIDLIYIDPPFATNSIFRTDIDRTQTVSMDETAEVAYLDTLTGCSFFEFLRERLIIARELLSDRGSIYLHIDYKIGHYIKILMDEIFGMENFRNDITRIKCNPKNFKRKAYGNIKDLILFYSKSNQPIWNECYQSYSQQDIDKLYKKNKNGRYYTTVPLHAPGTTKNGETAQPFRGIFPPKGRHWRCSPAELEELDEQGLIEWSKTNTPRRIIYADEKQGKKVQDIWEFKDPQYPVYPTEKNIDLLKRIVATSSNPDSIVMDFFCGSGTTLSAAEQLNRQWIGIDKSPKAIEATLKRLNSQKTLYSHPINVITFSTEEPLKRAS